jgi:hypothetical protein
MKDKIQDWIEKTGYALEMRVARTLRRAGFRAVQSEYYPDPSDPKKHREVDVVAYEDMTTDLHQSCLLLVLECKVTSAKPWVLFTNKREWPEGLSVQ